MFLESRLIGGSVLVERLADRPACRRSPSGRGRTGPRQDPRGQAPCPGRLACAVRPHPVHARSDAGRSHRFLDLPARQRHVRICAGVRSSTVLVLVDEINRAPPKVQSASARSDGRASGDGRPASPIRCPSRSWWWRRRTRSSTKVRSRCPEAQLDRFMLKVEVVLPDAAVERRILDLVEGEATGEKVESPAPISPAEIVAARKAAMAVFLLACRGRTTSSASSPRRARPRMPRSPARSSIRLRRAARWRSPPPPRRRRIWPAATMSCRRMSSTSRAIFSRTARS